MSSSSEGGMTQEEKWSEDYKSLTFWKHHHSVPTSKLHPDAQKRLEELRTVMITHYFRLSYKTNNEYGQFV